MQRSQLYLECLSGRCSPIEATADRVEMKPGGQDSVFLCASEHDQRLLLVGIVEHIISSYEVEGHAYCDHLILVALGVISSVYTEIAHIDSKVHLSTRPMYICSLNVYGGSNTCLSRFACYESLLSIKV